MLGNNCFARLLGYYVADNKSPVEEFFKEICLEETCSILNFLIPTFLPRLIVGGGKGFVCAIIEHIPMV